MPCLLLLRVVGEGFGAVLWRLWFQLTRLACGDSLLSRCGGSWFWMLGGVAYCATLLRWRPGTVRGGEPVDFIKEQILKMWILAL